MDIDKSGWPRGEWDNEPDQKHWVDLETSYPCIIVRHPEFGHLCGYVGIPKGHAAWGVSSDPLYDANGGELPRTQIQEAVCDLSVHGGITFYDQRSPELSPAHPGGFWWNGFDCSHAGDLSPGMSRFTTTPLTPFLSRMGGSTVYRNITYVMNECRELAKQLKAMETA